MYDHRAYVLRKNMLDPKLGRMQMADAEPKADGGAPGIPT